MRRIVNLTTHEISLYTEDGVICVPATGLARVDLEREVKEYAIIGGTTVPVHSVKACRIVGLPPPDGVTLFVVSSIVERYADRDDVVTVDKLIRGAGGVVVGAAALSRSA